MTTTSGTPATSKRANVGELRPSQLLFTFGVGSIVDLPNLSVMVMGLDDWTEPMKRLHEPRLLESVRAELGAQVRELRLPPAPESPSAMVRPNSDESFIGVPVSVFPRWLVCTFCRQLAGVGSGLFKLEVDPRRPDRTRYVHENCRGSRQSQVLPARFLVTCKQGHLDDFPWISFVHRGPSTCTPSLELLTTAASAEIASNIVKCRTCGTSRNMADAFGDDAPAAIGSCSGRRPQLRDYEAEPCTEAAQTILLGASTFWFAMPLSALAIPGESDELAQAVDAEWQVLSAFPSIEHLATFRVLRPTSPLLRWNDEEIWRAIEARRHASEEQASGARKSLRVPEWEAFTRSGQPRVTGDFKLRAVGTPKRYERLIRRVVQAERLREVRALIGFSRLVAPGELGEPHAESLAVRAPITRRTPEWVPASDVRGEGIFIELHEEVVRNWLETPAARERDARMRQAHRKDRERFERIPYDANYPGMRYVLLHSLSHALLRCLAVECGYAAASIRERVYSSDGSEDSAPMAGLLLYTAAPDSEGTLGGLVRLGEPEHLGRLLEGCLHSAEMCASDPLCAEHDPSIDGHALHAAACHACLFLPETCCERANRYLDRASLVRVFGSDAGGFFHATP